MEVSSQSSHILLDLLDRDPSSNPDNLVDDRDGNVGDGDLAPEKNGGDLSGIAGGGDLVSRASPDVPNAEDEDRDLENTVGDGGLGRYVEDPDPENNVGERGLDSNVGDRDRNPRGGDEVSPGYLDEVNSGEEGRRLDSLGGERDVNSGAGDGEDALSGGNARFEDRRGAYDRDELEKVLPPDGPSKLLRELRRPRSSRRWRLTAAARKLLCVSTGLRV
ncbi:hypothetical protein VTJ04DRAFT_2247 [Mycothermus thermophilus]|uniref:uncharacterized protein n=1 Tax=Humicola insolens TaxID=85995 RepID=UPI003743C391